MLGYRDGNEPSQFRNLNQTQRGSWDEGLVTGRKGMEVLDVLVAGHNLSLPKALMLGKVFEAEPGYYRLLKSNQCKETCTG